MTKKQSYQYEYHHLQLDEHQADIQTMSLSHEAQQQLGQLVIRTMPGLGAVDENQRVCAYWVIQQMEKAGCVIAKRHTQGPVTLVSMGSVSFKKRLAADDLVSFYVQCQAIGRTSITVEVYVYVQPAYAYEAYYVTEATLVLAHIDQQGQAMEINHYS